MDETKQFNLRTILSVTTGRLLTEPRGKDDNGIGDIYDLLGWMTMDAPSTHQLPRFADECKPHLFRLFPELGLASACLPKLDDWLKAAPTCPEEGIKMWLTELKMLFPEIKPAYDVPQFPITHTIKDPIAELLEMAPNIEIIKVTTSHPDIQEKS